MKRGNPNIAEAGKSTQFSSENQPENRGRKGKTVSEFLKEYGEGNKIEFEIKVYKDGLKKPKVQKCTIESETSINELMAVLIVKDAIQGDSKARATYIERTEGGVTQNLKHSGDPDNPVTQTVIFELPDNKRD